MDSDSDSKLNPKLFMIFFLKSLRVAFAIDNEGLQL